MLARSTVILLSSLPILAACAAPREATGKRQTLWDALAGPPAATRPGEPPPAPPRPHARTAAEELIERLRRGDSREDLAAVVRELVGRGPEGRAAAAEALDREELLVDVLRDVAAPPPGDGARARDVPWVAAKYRLARDRFLSGDHYGALRVIDAVFALEPDNALAADLRRLRRRAQDEALRSSVLLAELRPAAAVLAAGDPLEVSIELRNQGEQRLALAVDEEGQPIGLVSIDFEELLPDGARTRVRTQRPVAAPGGRLTLGPGQTTSLRLSLPTHHRELRAGTVGRYRLGGRLQPTRLVVGGLGYGASIPLLPVEVLVVAAADLPLAEDPQRAFTEAVAASRRAPVARRDEAARRAFVAAVLWGARDRDAALGAAAEALGEARGPLSDALCAALARLTGEPLAFSRGEWLAWWAERTDRPRADPGED